MDHFDRCLFKIQSRDERGQASENRPDSYLTRSIGQQIARESVDEPDVAYCALSLRAASRTRVSEDIQKVPHVGMG